MKNFNYNKLKGRIKEKGFTQSQIAKEIGINKSTLSIKMNNKTFFTQDEICRLVILLEIPNQEIREYFFTLEV